MKTNIRNSIKVKKLPLMARELSDSRKNAEMYRKSLLAETGGMLARVSLNIPGPIEDLPLAARCLEEGGRAAVCKLKIAGYEVKLIDRRKCICDDGSTYFYVDGNPAKIKKLLCETEDSHSMGNLINLDLYYLDEHNCEVKVSRRSLNIQERSCYICGRPMIECSRGFMHDYEEVLSNAQNIMRSWARHNLQEIISGNANRALHSELAATPKPGLIDRTNSGVHTGLDYFKYIDYVSALLPYCCEAAAIGFDSADTVIEQDMASTRTGDGGLFDVGTIDNSVLEKLFFDLRSAGKNAEASISLVSEGAAAGASTHNGIIFSYGIISAAYGWLYRAKPNFATNELYDLCKRIARPAMEDFISVTEENSKSDGENAFAIYGFTGLRGEAAHGFPTVREHSLPMLQLFLKRGYSVNDASVAALLKLISLVDDTSLLACSSAATMHDIQRAANEFLKTYPAMSDICHWISEMDLQFIDRKICARGSAHLLAVTLFILYLFAGFSVTDYPTQPLRYNM